MAARPGVIAIAKANSQGSRHGVQGNRFEVNSIRWLRNNAENCGDRSDSFQSSHGRVPWSVVPCSLFQPGKISRCGELAHLYRRFSLVDRLLRTVTPVTAESKRLGAERRLGRMRKVKPLFWFGKRFALRGSAVLELAQIDSFAFGPLSQHPERKL